MAVGTMAEPPGRGPKLPAARAFLLTHLSADWQPRADVFAAAADVGYRPRTLRRALDQLVDDGAVEQRRRARVEQLRLTDPRSSAQNCHASAPYQFLHYPKHDTDVPTILPPRGALAFGHTRHRYLHPAELPLPWYRYLADGLWAADHRLPQRWKEARCRQVVDVTRLGSGHTEEFDRYCHSPAYDVCAVLLHAPALAAIRDATGDRHRPARDYLWYDEITLPTDPADRARFRTALRQAEKRARDATAKAGDPWGGVAMSLGVRDGTKPWRTTVLCLLASHPVRIPAGVPTRGWERLPRADALRVLAEEVLLVGAISAQTQLRGAWRPTPDRWRRDDPIVGSLGPAPTGLYGPEWHTDETFDAALKTRWPDALDEFSAAGRSAAGRRRETVEAAELAAELASQLRRRGQQRRSTRR